MFYIGTPWMMAVAIILMAAQGFGVLVICLTLGFFGAVALPVMLVVHITGFIITVMYFSRKSEDPHAEPKKLRQFASPRTTAIRTVIGLALFIAAIVAGYEAGVAPMTKTSAEKRAVQEEAVRFLEQKYGESFEISELNYIWAGGSYHITAYPKLNPQLEFRMEAGDEIPTKFSGDDYLNRVWSSELSERLTPLVREFYPGGGFVDTYIYRDKEYYQEGEIFAHYDDLIGREEKIHSQKIDVIVFADVSRESFPSERERILSLIRRMEDVMVHTPIGLDIEFYPEALNTAENTAKMPAEFYSFEDQFKNDPKTHTVYISDIGALRSSGVIEIKEMELKGE